MKKILEGIFLIYIFLKILLNDYINYADRLITIFPRIPINFLFYLKLIILALGLLVAITNLRINKTNPTIKKNNLIVITLIILSCFSIFLVDNVYINGLNIIGENEYRGYLDINKKDNLIATLNFGSNFFICYILSSYCFNNEKSLSRLNIMLIATFYINFIIAFFQFLYFSGFISLTEVPVIFLSHSGSISMRVTGLFSNPFFFGSFLIITLNALLYKGLFNISRMFYYITFLCIFFSIIISGSKSVLIVSSITIFFKYFKKINIKVILTGIVLFLIVLFFSENITYLSRLTEFSLVNQSISLRIFTPLNTLYNLLRYNFMNIFFGIGINSIFISDMEFITILYRFGIIYLSLYIFLLNLTFLEIKKITNNQLRDYCHFSVLSLILLMFMVSGTGDANNMLYLIILQLPFSYNAKQNKNIVINMT